MHITLEAIRADGAATSCRPRLSLVQTAITYDHNVRSSRRDCSEAYSYYSNIHLLPQQTNSNGTNLRIFTTHLLEVQLRRNPGKIHCIPNGHYSYPPKQLVFRRAMNAT
jgi:hypothetical protein